MMSKLPQIDPDAPELRNLPRVRPEDLDYDPQNDDWLRLIEWRHWPRDREECRRYLVWTHAVGTKFMPVEQWKTGPAWQEAIKHRPELKDLWDNDDGDAAAESLPHSADVKHAD